MYTLVFRSAVDIERREGLATHSVWYTAGDRGVIVD